MFFDWRNVHGCVTHLAPPTPPIRTDRLSTRLRSLTTFHLAPQFKEILRVLVIACSASPSERPMDACPPHQVAETFRLLNPSWVFFFHVSRSCDGGKVLVHVSGKKGLFFSPSLEGDTWHPVPEQTVCHSSGGIVSHSYIKKFKHPIRLPLRWAISILFEMLKL